MEYDIAVIGGSIGGVMAAIRAAENGFRVVLTERTDWIGGQFTSQAVPPDEHKYIETCGATRSYMAYRKKVRDYYRMHPFIADELKNKECFCPGGSSVSRLAHPPKLALRFIEEMTAPHVKSGRLTILLHTSLVRAESDGETIRSVTVQDERGEKELRAAFYLDGTDEGELIALSGAAYVTGAESRADTHEPHAPVCGDEKDMQPVTWVGAVDFDPSPAADFVIPKPPEYAYFRRLKMPYDRYDVLSMYGPDSSTGKAKQYGFFNGETGENGEKLFGLFTYRRIVCSRHFKDGYEPKDVTLINWPQNDYFMDNIFGTEDDAHHRYMAKQLTLSLIYWLQTEAPRADGGKGYRGLRLRGDVLGTDDGLAKAPYIRESRRIVAKKTVTENSISKKANAKPPRFADSVGVGSYPIDLHITTRSHSFFYEDTHPFQIPLGAMIPVKMKNMFPACKNIGTTHLTNGCYRLHPVEWNIGEAAGLLVSYILKNRVSATEIYENTTEMKRFGDFLTANGIPLQWDLPEYDSEGEDR